MVRYSLRTLLSHLQIYGSTVVPLVRHRCLGTLVKLVYYSTPDMLTTGAQAPEPARALLDV